MFAWSLRSRLANMRRLNCFAIRPARPAKPCETISLRGLRPLKLPFDMVCLHSETVSHKVVIYFRHFYQQIVTKS